ncbi:hypothetical protein, conserved [Trypanosoma brucei gambiense DAL972]|uniref:NOT2/NOT3/NOT5 C-terminal domain-containing protein n=1 Tax=Trypanosoma brucei gambiense (strain MHOM/CI/86/DAL972) TaxID=679716 RepID=C9ZQA2_TRYB9|nr:hypothetical protein, conserved [Trypanosoma brucei gambiense DAL972]CBH11582.1 hypothetical protein, conserved [Trypanosoma brucei gambiense DAL972]|eukprot:XP_011773867.1 hypothetical protein, conserved [Trypanosoma brucei gambiense DAL972]
MNNSNQGTRYPGTIPQGIPIAYPAQAGAPNPYQSLRGVFPVTTQALVAQQQQLQQQQQQQQAQLQQQQQQHRPNFSNSSSNNRLNSNSNSSNNNNNFSNSNSNNNNNRLNSNPVGVWQWKVLTASSHYQTSFNILLTQKSLTARHFCILHVALNSTHSELMSLSRGLYTQHSRVLHMLQKYKNETLFYIFYSMPRDLLQTVAAKVLVSRGWCFHKARHQWMRRVVQNEYEVFNQNAWKLENEEMHQLNASDLLRDIPDSFLAAPGTTGTGAAAPPPTSTNSNSSGNNNNNNNNNSSVVGGD